MGRAISLVERLGPEGRAVAAALHPETGRAWRVGVTGAPGVGKSTLIAALVRLLRGRGKRVAVVSVDPTSPFTRGAVLGDRIRLTDHFLDPGVFIRSMASRGHQGGLAEATADAVLVLDAAGYDVVLIETVGSGQNEVEVRTLADTVVLALMPGSGDGVQAIKAGLMEIPDVLAVTKADREGAKAMVSELRNALSLVPAGPWEPPIVRVRALEEGGADGAVGRGRGAPGVPRRRGPPGGAPPRRPRPPAPRPRRRADRPPGRLRGRRGVPRRADRRGPGAPPRPLRRRRPGPGAGRARLRARGPARSGGG